MSTPASVRAEHAVASASAVGMGQIGSHGHPLHPATVHFPIGLLALSFSLDALQLLPVPTLGATFLPPAALMRPLAHYTGAAGLLGALPAVMTGLSELYGMWRGTVEDTRSVRTIAGDAKGAVQSDAVQGQKLRTTLTHATINDIVLAVAAWNWWIRRDSPTLSLPSFNAGLSALMIPMFMYSAYLGGSLVYEYGVGVQRQGVAKQIKEKN